MTVEALLAYAHFIAIFTLIVFITSEAALLRPQWFNAEVVRRLGKVDLIYGIAAGAVLATGLMRVFLGLKPASYYGMNWLLWVKFGLFLVIGITSIKPTIMFIRWRKALDANGTMPSDEEVGRARKLVMFQAHLIPLIPLAAVFLARGYGSLRP